MTEIRDSSDLLDAHSQAKWALRSVAGGLEVSDADVARLEREFIVGRSSRPQRLVRPRQNWPVAACAVLALALALTALWAVGGGRGIPATAAPSALASRPLTAADLVGVWRVDYDPSPIVWVLNANGKAAIWSTPRRFPFQERRRFPFLPRQHPRSSSATRAQSVATLRDQR